MSDRDGCLVCNGQGFIVSGATYTSPYGEKEQCPLCWLETERDRLTAENKRLTARVEDLIEYLSDAAPSFKEEYENAKDLVSAIDGFFCAYQEIIDMFPGETYSSDPLELVGRLINERDDLAAQLATTQKECERLREENECLDYDIGLKEDLVREIREDIQSLYRDRGEDSLTRKTCNKIIKATQPPC